MKTKPWALTILFLANFARAEYLPTSSQDSTVYNATGTFSFTNIEIKTTGAWSELGRKGWNIGLTKNHKPIVRIDSDGDIFFREKWIGWSGTLSKEIKEFADIEGFK